jgi:hypothetical protein
MHISRPKSPSTTSIEQLIPQKSHLEVRTVAREAPRSLHSERWLTLAMSKVAHACVVLVHLWFLAFPGVSELFVPSFTVAM